MEKIHENVHINFLCFHVNFKHKSTKTCTFPCKFSFSAYFYSHYIIMVKGLLAQCLTLAQTRSFRTAPPTAPWPPPPLCGKRGGATEGQRQPGRRGRSHTGGKRRRVGRRSGCVPPVRSSFRGQLQLLTGGRGQDNDRGPSDFPVRFRIITGRS